MEKNYVVISDGMSLSVMGVGVGELLYGRESFAYGPATQAQCNNFAASMGEELNGTAAI